jgi:transposase
MVTQLKSILTLYTKGESKKTISRRTGVTRNTVKKYIRLYIAFDIPLSELLKRSDAELESLFIGKVEPQASDRQKNMYAFFPEVEKALKKKGESRATMWSKYINMYPDGFSYPHFKKMYQRWTGQHNTVMHIEHKAGDKMYVDYAGDKLSFINLANNEEVFAEVFVAILGASQLIYAEATMSQQKEDFVQSCENAIYYFGGAPQAIVTDNLKSAVIKSDKYEPTLNETFNDFVNHYNMTALPAKPYKPRYKALVEGAVKIIYTGIHCEVRKGKYYSLEELNNAIAGHLTVLNDRMLHGRKYSRRQMFEEVERGELQPLPLCRYELRRKKVATVMKNSHVNLSEDKHYYSVPNEHVGSKVIILYNTTDVEIYYHYECIAKHRRNRKMFGYTTKEEHLATKYRFMSDWSPEKFIERAGFVGDDTKQYVTIVLRLKQHPEQAYKSCQGILSFIPKVGAERLNAACKRAAYYRDYSYKTIKAILERKLDMIPFENEEDASKMPDHGNIRGNAYYR